TTSVPLETATPAMPGSRRSLRPFPLLSSKTNPVASCCEKSGRVLKKRKKNMSFFFVVIVVGFYCCLVCGYGIFLNDLQAYSVSASNASASLLAPIRKRELLHHSSPSTSFTME